MFNRIHSVCRAKRRFMNPSGIDTASCSKRHGGCGAGRDRRFRLLRLTFWHVDAAK